MRAIALLIALSMTMFVAGCGDDDDGPTGPGASAEFEVIQPTVDSYTDSDIAPTISAQALFDNLNDGDASNNPTIVSVRSAAHYGIGHIEGAINIPWREVGDAAQLAKLSKNDDIVIYCYTGHTGGVATTALQALGYQATNMKFGMSAWSKDPAVRVATPFTEANDANNFPTETTVNAADSYELANPDYTAQDGEEAILMAAVENYLVDGAPVITAKAVFDNINDGDASNDPIVVSVRAEAHYALGHVPGAINIPWRSIAKVENLEKLPTDRQIVIYCYTGHTGAVATTALNLLGYDAINMKFGMGSWTQDATVRVAAPFSEAAVVGFPTVQ
ncbi:MAG: rhodanese-like domain-containing protein [Gemmatimonadetes bacterium]|mgnify:FL=1|jgi:rhodanese-related sulfurtransferase|nr:rhodanese-like domain-containing protein [Gemmatimonadota bacterium]MBT6148359.1 rhodanese-like domain-containing protein [Gemmatimonadota bacterium]